MQSIELDKDSVRLALDIAWREHQHVRDQAWKSVQFVALLAAGLVVIDVRFESSLATLVSGLTVIGLGYWGAITTVHHRAYQIQKFTEILNCEKELGLIPRIVPDSVRAPSPMTIWDAFSPRVSHTPVFILRMHVALIIFGVLFTACRLFRAC